MVLNKTLKKRTSKGRVIVDIEDIRILKILDNYSKKNQTLTFLGLREKLNISYNSLNVHINRLGALGFILVFAGTGKDYKNKFTRITPEGKTFVKLILKNHKQIFINGQLVDLWETEHSKNGQNK